MRRILAVGGGHAGFYTAWKLEKKLRQGEARVVVVDPRRTTLISGTVVGVDHAHRTATVRPADGPECALPDDVVVVTAGAVTRKLGIPGMAEQAIGLKHVEEAVAVCDRLLTAFDRAATLEPGPLRRRLLTVTFVGGGFSGPSTDAGRWSSGPTCGSVPRRSPCRTPGVPATTRRSRTSLQPATAP